jgi:replicative DNA helicase
MNQPPPNDVDAETAYIGNALLVDGYVDEHHCPPNDFYDGQNQRIVRALQAVHARGHGVDVAGVMAQLKADGITGCSARLADAMNSPTRVGGDLERTIRDCARRRRVIDLSRMLSANSYDRTQDIDRLVASSCLDLESTGADLESGKAATLQALLAGAHARAITRGSDGVSCSVAYPLGHWRLERDTGGLRPSKVAICGAPSHWGKSSFALMVADLNLTAKNNVLIVSAEDDDELWADRWLQYRADLPRGRFESGILTPEQMSAMTNAVSDAPQAPVLLNAIGRTPEWTVRQVRSIMRRTPGDWLVMFDYLGAWVDEKTKGDDQRLRINYIARQFTNCIKQTKAAGLIFSQITPSDKMGMYSLRDSKDIANAAEVIFLGGLDSSDGRVIKLAKNKPGPAKAGGIYEMGTNTKSQCFEPVGNAGDWDWGAIDGP